MEDVLQRVLAKQEIYELSCRYSRGLDRLDGCHPPVVDERIDLARQPGHALRPVRRIHGGNHRDSQSVGRAQHPALVVQDPRGDPARHRRVVVVVG